MKKIRRRLLIIPFGLLGYACLPLPLAGQTAEDPNHGFTIHHDRDTDSLNLSWWGIGGHIYLIQTSDDMMNWGFIPVYDTGADAPLQWSFSAVTGPIFFRLRGSDDPASPLLSASYNEAGVSLWDQIQLGFDPFGWADTNADGIHDAWELYYFEALNVVDPQAASAEDGLSYLDAFKMGLDPFAEESADPALRENFSYDDRGWLAGYAQPPGNAAAYFFDEEGNPVGSQ